jgi:hypothetical protein
LELLGFGPESRLDRPARVKRSISAKVGGKPEQQPARVKRSVSAKVGQKPPPPD